MISVITPTLDEEANLEARASDLARQTGEWEWIVADGGSEDGTRELARELGATVVTAPKGRGPQLNAGADRASGDILLFLHADTQLPPGSLDAIRRALDDDDVAGGHFTIEFAGDHLESRALELGYSLWEKIFGTYFGDSTIFVRRDVFRELGGYPDQEILEDYDFVRKLERAEETRDLDEPVVSSDRRYRGRLGRSVVQWLSIIGLHELGVSAEALKGLYPPENEE